MSLGSYKALNDLNDFCMSCSVLFKMVLMHPTPSIRHFRQRRLWNSASASLTGDCPISYIQRRSSGAFYFCFSFLHITDGPQVLSQAPQYFRSFEWQATCDGCFVLQSCLSVRSFPLNTARLWQYIRRSLRRWMSNIVQTYAFSEFVSYFYFRISDRRSRAPCWKHSPTSLTCLTTFPKTSKTKASPLTPPTSRPTKR